MSDFKDGNKGALALTDDILLQEDVMLTEEQKKKILGDRAKELAKELNEEQVDLNSFDIIQFVLNDETYGINTKYIKQVAKAGALSKIPGVPKYVLGVTSLQEQIVPVVDIRTFFGFTLKENQKDFNIIVISSENMEFAISVDNIVGVGTIDQKSVQTSIEGMEDTKKKYFYGITKDQVIILDAEKILSDTEMVVS